MKDLMNYLENTSIEDVIENTDVTRAIVRDEFNRKNPRWSSSQLADYTSRAIDKLIKMRVTWYSEGNISYQVTQRFVKIVCPYCSKMMDFEGVGNKTFVCKSCGASAVVNADITFKPTS